MRNPAPLLLFALTLCAATACGDDSATDGPRTDDGGGENGSGSDGASDEQEGGSVATGDGADDAQDIPADGPDAGPSAPIIDAPIADEIDADDAFELELCRDVTFDPERDRDEQLARCNDCCAQRVYTLARFVFEQTCACARRPTFTDDGACGMHAGDADACGACCEEAGFTDANAEGGCECSRERVEDSEVCADTGTGDSPAIACEACCLESGLFGFTFTGGSDSPECRCLEPG